MTGEDDHEGKVVSLEPRLKSRQPNHDEASRQKLGATSDEIAAQLLSAAHELHRKR